jgi:hypothetical protein
MPDELKPEPRADFAADFRDGEVMAREWIAGRGDLPDLLHIVRDETRRPFWIKDAGSGLASDCRRLRYGACDGVCMRLRPPARGVIGGSSIGKGIDLIDDWFAKIFHPRPDVGCGIKVGLLACSLPEMMLRVFV